MKTRDSFDIRSIRSGECFAVDGKHVPQCASDETLLVVGTPDGVLIARQAGDASVYDEIAVEFIRRSDNALRQLAVIGCANDVDGCESEGRLYEMPRAREYHGFMWADGDEDADVSVEYDMGDDVVWWR